MISDPTSVQLCSNFFLNIKNAKSEEKPIASALESLKKTPHLKNFTSFVCHMEHIVECNNLDIAIDDFTLGRKFIVQTLTVAQEISDKSSLGQIYCGILEYAARLKRKDYSNLSHHPQLSDLVASVEKSINLYELENSLSQDQDDDIWENKIDSWIPQYLKAEIIDHCTRSLKENISIDYDLNRFLAFLARQSGIAIAPIVIEYFRNSTLSKENTQTILLLCAQTDGILIIPFLTDLKTHLFFTDEIVERAFLKSKAYFSMVISEQEMNQIIEELNLRESEIIKKLSFEFYAQHTPLEFKFRSCNEVIKSRTKSDHFQHLLQAIKIYLVEPTIFHKDHIRTLIGQMEKSSGFLLEGVESILKKLESSHNFENRVNEILPLFKFSRVDKIKLASLFITHRPIALTLLREIDLSKEELLNFSSKIEMNANQFLEILKNLSFPLSDPDILDLLVDKIIKLNDSDFINFPFAELNLSHERNGHQKAINTLISRLLIAQHFSEEITPFWNPSTLVAIDKRWNASFLALGQLILIRSDTVLGYNEEINNKDFCKNCLNYFSKVEATFPELGSVLLYLWKDKRIDLLIDDLLSINQVMDGIERSSEKYKAYTILFRQKCLKIHEMALELRCIVKAFVQLFYIAEAKEAIKSLALGFNALKQIVIRDFFIKDTLVSFFSNQSVVQFPKVIEETTFKSPLFPILFFLVKNTRLLTEKNSWWDAFNNQQVIELLAASINHFQINKWDASFYFEEIIQMLQLKESPVQELSSKCKELIASTLAINEACERGSFWMEKALDSLASNFLITKEQLKTILIPKNSFASMCLFYEIWKKNSTVCEPFLFWIQFLIEGPNSVKQLRFERGSQGVFFKKFPVLIKEFYQHEIVIDIEKIRKNIPEKSHFLDYHPLVSSFQSHVPDLFQLSNEILQAINSPISAQLTIDSLISFKDWQQYIKAAKVQFKQDQQKQNEIAAQLRVLKTLSMLFKDKSKIHSLQNALGKWNVFRKFDLKELYKELEYFRNTYSWHTTELLDKLSMIWTHDSELLFTIPSQALGSCQKIHKSEVQNYALVNRVTNGKQKLFLISNKQTTEPLAVALTKLAHNERNEPVILLEPLYQCYGCSIPSRQLLEVVVLSILKQIESLNQKMDLVIGKVDKNLHTFETKSSSFFAVSPYGQNLHCFAGEYGMEYEDTARLEVRNSDYAIDKQYLLKVDYNYSCS